MKKNPILFLIVLFTLCSLRSQTIRNFGDTEIHNNGQLGFFSSVVNDGSLISYSGLLGIYGEKSLSFSGSSTPNIYDMEVAHEEGVFLNIPITVNNNMNYIYGDIRTDKYNSNTYLELTADAFYEGASDFSKIDGYAQSVVSGDYIFPVGDEFYLRPLAVNTSPQNSTLKCAYFFENPLDVYLAHNDSKNEIVAISTNEFWKLEGSSSVSITLSWNDRSAIAELTSNTQFLTIVAYHKETNEWQDLGSLETTGSINEGFVTSDNFIPNDYEVISFGTVGTAAPLSHKGYHYIVTPNNDGINDFLYIPELEEYESNTMQIFDRNGLKVFETENYTNEFKGTTSTSIAAFNRDTGLPSGIYFYLIHLNNKELTLQGFLYLQRE